MTPKRLTIVMATFVALTYTVISLRRGPVFSPDSSTYSDWADRLIRSHFNYASWAGSIQSIDPPLAYSVWVTIVALNKIALGTAWSRGILVFNLVLAVAVASMALSLIKRLTSSSLAVAYSGVIFLFAFELWLWIPYVLSDVSFMFITFAAFCLLCLDTGLARRVSRWRALPLALATIALIYRPAGLPLAILVVGATVFGPRLRGAGADMRLKIARRAAWSLLGLIAIAVVLDASLIAHPDIWPFRFASPWIHELNREYSQGIVVYERPDTYHAPQSGVLAFMWLDLDRLRWFWAFSAAGFSTGHNLANIVFFVPVYVGCLIALGSLMRSRNSFSLPTWWATAVGSSFVILVWVFHSMQYVDFDWRYRLPCLPVLIVLSAIGWQELIRQIVSARSGGTFTAEVGAT